MPHLPLLLLLLPAVAVVADRASGQEVVSVENTTAQPPATCSTRQECSECLSSSLCGWCGKCVEGDILGPYSTCPDRYSHTSCSPPAFWRWLDPLLGVAGVAVGLAVCFRGCRHIVFMICTLSALGAGGAAGLLLMKLVSGDLLPVSTRGALCIAFAVGLGAGTLPYASYVGCLPRVFLKGGVAAMGVELAVVGVPYLLTFRISGVGGLTPVASSPWGVLVVMWGITLALGILLGLRALKGSPSVFLGAMAFGGSFLSMLSLDVVVSGLRGRHGMGVVDGLLRVASAHTTHGVYSGIPWDAVSYVIYFATFAVALVGAVYQCRAASVHLDGLQLTARRPAGDSLESYTQLQPIGSDAEPLSDAASDESLVLRARRNLDLRHSLPTSVQALCVLGLAREPQIQRERRRSPRRAARVVEEIPLCNPVPDSGRGRKRKTKKGKRKRNETPSSPSSDSSPPSPPQPPPSPPPPRNQDKFTVGDGVEVLYEDSGWFGAVVTGIEESGTYSVVYDTGEVCSGVFAESMRHRVEPSLASSQVLKAGIAQNDSGLDGEKPGPNPSFRK